VELVRHTKTCGYPDMISRRKEVCLLKEANFVRLRYVNPSRLANDLAEVFHKKIT